MLLQLLYGILLQTLKTMENGILLSGKFQELPREGSTIQVFIKPPNSNGMKFKPEILKYEPEKEIRWLGKLWIPKIFDGEHSLTIKKIEENKVLFIQKEQFNGLLVPLFTNMLKDTKLGFQMMNQKLKQKAEEKME